MQDKILLGFIQDGEKTGYQIKKMMETSTVYFFNTSLGSIYPAFKKLEKEGMARMRQEVSDGRAKKIYSITPKGKRYFVNWLKEEMMIPKARDEVLLKMFFFGALDKETRKEQIKSFIDQLKNQVKELNLILNTIERNISGRDKKEVISYFEKYNLDPFRLEILEYGVAYYKLLHKWHKEFYKRLDHLSD